MRLIARAELLREWQENHDLSRLSNLLRHNAFFLVQQAGSGHIGTSFSVMDLWIAVHEYEQGSSFPSPNFNGYRIFSSKGHDAPAMYAINHFLGIIGDDEMILRRLDCLPGHPELGKGGAITNTGSLGMGISKAKGFAFADIRKNTDLTTYVILGDGEMQEGQIWESMLDGARIQGRLVCVVDGNGIQSDTWVNRVRSLGDVGARVRASDWNYLECHGHDFADLHHAYETARSMTGPSLIWAKTVKGYGTRITESFPEEGLFYPFHSGAVDPEVENAIVSELGDRGSVKSIPDVGSYSTSPKTNSHTTTNLWSEILLEFFEQNSSLIAMDGDLTLDTGTYSLYPDFQERHLQMGIAEQDMVSMAGTIALSGLTPIVHSFATFLTMRPFEQIVNNASEQSRIVYVGFLSGVVPSAPGFSHQAVLDAAIMSKIPGMRVIEPATEYEMRAALDEALRHDGPTYLRINSVPVPKVSKELSINVRGRTSVSNGSDYIIFCSGSFLLSQALQAQALLSSENILGSIVTVPNKFGAEYDSELESAIAEHTAVLFLENGVWFEGTLSRIRQNVIASGNSVSTKCIQGFPVSGDMVEVTKHYELDPESLADCIRGLLARPKL